MAEIPKVKIAVLGGSTTIGANFPRAYKGVNVIADGLVFETPFGPTALSRTLRLTARSSR